mmetsp:Transcript_44380/g.62280  ORF Transcript_44380/g.62280 Transcript_44380/m.62280 type:complete len:186 (+) Transcript_44380:29-586(+)
MENGLNPGESFFKLTENVEKKAIEERLHDFHSALRNLDLLEKELKNQDEYQFLRAEEISPCQEPAVEEIEEFLEESKMYRSLCGGFFGDFDCLLDNLEARKSSPPKKRRKIASKRKLLFGQCASCGTTESSEWRRGPGGVKNLCNACGIRFRKYLKKTNQGGDGDGHWLRWDHDPRVFLQSTQAK